MRKFTVILFSFVTFISFNKVEGKNTNVKNNSVLNLKVDETSPIKKKKTAVINESKKVDDQVQNELDALLDDFMKEMDNNKLEFDNLTSQVINTAFDYEGVRYRFGGMSRKGMDCSGLVQTAFGDTEISLPRSSSEMAQVGERVKQRDAQKGDLIFFKTRGNRISHVGIVTEVFDDEIKFIHSSTSRGVIVSSTKENYYQRTFAQINRVVQ